MGQSEENRERLLENDFPILENLTLEMESRVKEFLQLVPISAVNEWPHRYSLEFEGVELEVIFSQMGSFTIRLSKSERYRRNPPPLFYLSIGKYSNQYIWEDLNGKNIPLADLPNQINIAIHYYIQNSEI
ncbi:MAG: hypothetical protein SFU98_16635 [Leptospiraceae bacterium]|nr:hypothetical protein [Leptospiraceae bacterium]